MPGLLLDPYTGKPNGEDVLPILSPRGVPITMEDNYRRGWRGGDLGGQPSTKSLMDGLPDHIQEMLAKSRGDSGPFAGMRPPMNDHSNYEVLRYWITADTSITAAAEAIMVPAFNFGTSEMNVGSSLKMTLVGSQSVNATPGTFIYRMRWGGVAGALQATGPTITPSNSATVTTQSFVLEYWMTVRSTGATGTMWTQGNLQCAGFLLAAATSTQVVTYLTSQCQIPSQTAAVGASTDFTAQAGPSPTYQPSASTANCTTHLAFLECLN